MPAPSDASESRFEAGPPNDTIPPSTVLSPWRSRVGRRALLLFIAVAIVPVALLGTLASRALDEAGQRVDHRAVNQGVRQVGKQLIGQLVSAKEMLGYWPLTAPAAGLPPGLTKVFREAVLLSDSGDEVWRGEVAAAPGPGPSASAATAVVGPSLLQRWQQAEADAGKGTAGALRHAGTASTPQEGAVAADAVTVRMRSLPGDPEQGRAAQVMLGREVGGHLRWVVLLAPERLWSPVRDSAEGAAWTVFDPQGRVLMTAGQEPADQASEATQAQWALGLRAELDSGDWTLRQQRGATEHRIAGVAWRHWLALVGLAVLGLVGLVSLIQIRRTLVPLGQLTEGAARLAGGDTTVRLPCDASDEFGDLARGFNHMAGRIDDQLQSLHMLAAIDRDILRRAPPEEVGEHILSQFVLSNAGTHALVAWVEEAAVPMLHVLICSSQQPAPVAMSPVVLTSDMFSTFRALSVDVAMRRETVPDHLAPPWVTPILHDSVRQLAVYCVPFASALSAETNRQGGARPAARRNRAVLCVGLPRQRTHVLRPILHRAEELRDRLAVAYAARERDDLLLYRAMHDSLTGLTNRRGLNEFTDALLVADPQSARAVLFIDLDRFKAINDALGHAAGDELLREAAQRLLALAPPGAVVARPGGDEFVMLLAQAGEAQACAMARMVCERMAQPFRLLGNEHVLGACVGIALAPQHGLSREELLRHADMALYAAKGAGRGRFDLYSAPMDEAARQRLQLARELRLAIDRGELVPYFQPRVRVSDGAITSAEALVRWHHPTRGQLMPATFIGLAEESDLIEGLGLRMLDASCAQMAQWRRDGLTLERVAVNVSPRQLRSGRFLGQVRDALDHHGVPPQALALEVTESLLADDGPAIEQLAELRRWGVTIALDDFGTGSSSLAALPGLPIDAMKVDRAFMTALGRDIGALASTRAVLTLAKTLGHRTVAEGVETEAQATLLRELGCDELQGFLYGKPMPPEQLADLPGIRRN